MAFTETPQEKQKRQAKEMGWKKDAEAKQAKADAEDMRKFNETTNVDTSANTNAAGDTYKKGGSASARADGCAIRGKTRA